MAVDKNQEKGSFLRLAAEYTKAILSLRVELAGLTDKNEINVQKKHIVTLNE